MAHIKYETMYDFDKVYDRKNTGSLKWDVKEGELPMWVADMDFMCAPEIIRALKKRTEHGIFGYTDINDNWREAYVSWWDKRHSFKMDGGKLLFCSGIVPAAASLIRCLTKPSDGVIVMAPVYNIFFNLIKQNGRTVKESCLIYERSSGTFQIDFDDLENKMSDENTTLLILCNPQNPVGKIWSRDELEAVGELAVKHNVFVLSDEIHCDITAPGKLYTPFASVNDLNRNNSATLISPTKAFNLAGIQTSCVYAYDANIRSKIADSLNIDNINEPNVFAVPATVAAFEKSGDWLDAMRDYVFKNRSFAEKYIESEIPLLVPVKGDATYLLWVDIERCHMSSTEFTARLRSKTGLFITPGKVYGSNGDGFVRINLACPKSLVEEGLRRLKEFCGSVTQH